MENKKKTAGETARERRSLTPAQMENLVMVSCEISEINSAIKNVHPENGYKKTVILRGGHGEVAVTSHHDMNTVRDMNGDPMVTIHDPQFFELIAQYFNDKKTLLVEEIEAIMSEKGGEE